jgi:hypothetical protein
VAPTGIPGYSAATIDVGTPIRSHFDVEPDGSGLLTLGGVRAAWNRQVSPAPATATFNDVPTGQPQFAFVEAFVGAGITAASAAGTLARTIPDERPDGGPTSP